MVDNMMEEDLPFPKCDFVKYISLSARFSPFIYNKQKYQQQSGLLLGFSLDCPTSTQVYYSWKLQEKKASLE